MITGRVGSTRVREWLNDVETPSNINSPPESPCYDFPRTSTFSTAEEENWEYLADDLDDDQISIIPFEPNFDEKKFFVNN